LASKIEKTGLAFGAVIVVVVAVALATYYLSRHNIAVLQPAGKIGQEELQLVIIGAVLAVFVVVPVYILTIMIAIRYRAGNKKAKYDPNFSHSRVLESFWWGIPLLIITILSVITWQSAHALDPFKRLSYSKTVNVDVVALDWKWLFIYPDLKIASVNMLEFPTGQQVHFNITSDTVMNSFWIPQLGSQIYAMPGMSTQLYLEADKLGSYAGSSANISGSGFSSMTFTAKAVSAAEFNQWTKIVRQSGSVLNQTSYNRLSAPTDGFPVKYYSFVDAGLYANVVDKYMEPSGDGTGNMVMQ
jgi:cytochrome o ubiquinol oxidase subunit II